MSDTHKQALTTVPATTPPERMHPLVALAMKGGELDTATLREVMQMQREWEAGESEKLYTAAMLALKSELPTVLPRTKKGAHSKYTPLDQIVDSVSPHLQAHGFTATWLPACDGRMVTVTCKLTHAGGHTETATMTAPSDTGPGRNAVQAIGSTQRYLERYTLSAVLGITTADMSDADDPVSPDTVDTDRNMRCSAWLSRKGIKLADAEELVEKAREDWTVADLDTIREKWA